MKSAVPLSESVILQIASSASAVLPEAVERRRPRCGRSPRFRQRLALHPVELLEPKGVGELRHRVRDLHAAPRPWATRRRPSRSHHVERGLQAQRRFSCGRPDRAVGAGERVRRVRAPPPTPSVYVTAGRPPGMLPSSPVVIGAAAVIALLVLLIAVRRLRALVGGARVEARPRRRPEARTAGRDRRRTSSASPNSPTTTRAKRSPSAKSRGLSSSPKTFRDISESDVIRAKVLSCSTRGAPPRTRRS